jgi:hypothetical protein
MSDARDASTLAHVLTDSGTSDAAGVVGRARAVAPGAVLESTPEAALHVSSDLTISAWVAFDELKSGNYRNSIVTFGDPAFGFDTNFQYGIYVTSATNLFSYWAHGNASTVQNTSSVATDIPLGEFHHVAMVRDTSAGVMRYYYDGAELGSAQAYAALPDGGSLSHLVVGGNAADESFSMTGVLDEVRISAWAAPSAWIAAEHASMTGTLTSAIMDP